MHRSTAFASDTRAMLRGRSVYILLACCCLLLLAWQGSSHYNLRYPHQAVQYSEIQDPQQTTEGHSTTESQQVTLVVASQSSDDTTWLRGKFPAWRHVFYVTDDRVKGHLSVPMNKGRESMVYLTYIIDHYDQLTEMVIFQHANRYQWHNDDPLYDGERMLQRLQLSYIQQHGYANLRCVWTLGCPSEIHPLDENLPDADSESEDARAGSFYKHAFEELFPEISVPEAIGLSCCAQFAVTAGKIRERPRSDYVRYREWLLETTLPDSLSGRIMEYSWHIIFGQDAVFCPRASDCYCNLYGLCNISCEEEGTCSSQYTLPRYSTMPKGWPEYGWEGEWRNVTEMREVQGLDYSPSQT